MSTNIDETELTHDKIQAEIAKIFTENKKMQVEIEKMRTETTKLQKETTLYPLVVGASLILAGGSAAIGAVAVIKLFL